MLDVSIVTKEASRSTLDLSIRTLDLSNTRLDVSIVVMEVSKSAMDVSIRTMDLSNTRLDVSIVVMEISKSAMDVSTRTMDLSARTMDLGPFTPVRRSTLLTPCHKHPASRPASGPYHVVQAMIRLRRPEGK